MRSSLDAGDRLVDLECLGNRNTALGADAVPVQTEKGGGNKIGMIGMLVAVTKYEGVVTREGEPYSIMVIVLLTLSASAIAMPAFGSSLLPPKLK